MSAAAVTLFAVFLLLVLAAVSRAACT